MNYIKKLWKSFKNSLKKYFREDPKEDDYFYLDDMIDLEDSVEILEKEMVQQRINLVDCSTQTDINQENGYIIYRSNFDKYIEEERYRIKIETIVNYENKMLEGFFPDSEE